MRMLKKIAVFPIMLFVAIMSTCIKRIVKIESHIAAVAKVFLMICVMLAVINRMWLQLGIFAIIFAAGFLILLFSVQLSVWMEVLLDRLKQV